MTLCWSHLFLFIAYSSEYLPAENKTRNNSDCIANFIHIGILLYKKKLRNRAIWRVERKRIRIWEASKKVKLSWSKGNILKTVDNKWNMLIFIDECKVDVGNGICGLSGEKWRRSGCHIVFHNPWGKSLVWWYWVALLIMVWVLRLVVLIVLVPEIILI